MDYKKTVKRGPRNKIADVIYELRPDFNFIEEMKKANGRSKKITGAYSSHGIRSLS